MLLNIHNKPMLRPAKNACPTKQRRLTAPERLEDRLAMDGAGFVNTDPPEDPHSIVGLAGVVAHDDHLVVKAGTQSLWISPLKNDALPDGAESLRIKSVSASRGGATVTISEDGRHLIYTAGEGGFTVWDSLYYIVETDDGRLGKASVNLGRKDELGSYVHPVSTGRDNVTVLEDSAEATLTVLQNDWSRLSNPVILSVASPSRGGSVRISDDGLSLRYQPKHGESGAEYFTYTARGDDGVEAVFEVRVTIEKRYVINTRYDSASLSFGAGATTLDPLANDSVRSTTPLQPYIDHWTAPDYAGEVTLSPDERRFIFTPADGYLGSFTVQYTIRYGAEEHQTVSSSFLITVSQHTWAVENWFHVDPAIDEPATLDVLSNNPSYLPSSFTTHQAHYLPRLSDVSSHLVAVTAGSDGGQISIATDGKSISYLPADGFTGDETFTYTMEDATGLRQSATATVHVGPRGTDASGVDRFTTEGELRQYLIDRAVAKYLGQFGQHQSRYTNYPNNYLIHLASDSLAPNGVGLRDADYSETNTQVSGVDEADIVETDGRYIYTLTHGQLAIVDLQNPSTPRLASLTTFDKGYDKMYLAGGRLTLIRSGSIHRYGDAENNAEVLVLDLGDRTAPSIVERTEINGFIADSRAIGDRVHLVVKRYFELPDLSGEWVIAPAPPSQTTTAATSARVVAATDALVADYWMPVTYGEAGVWRNETLDQYLHRVREELFDVGLPSYRSFDASGELVSSGLLTEPADLHKAIAGEDLVVSLLTLDAGDDLAGPVADATSFIADDQTTVFMSADAAYLFSYEHATDSTTIHKLAFQAGGDAPLVASGLIRGRLLNQFSADEFDGTLRVATTQQEREARFNGGWRQTRLFNNLLILEQRGSQLELVGEITNLAPTESIHSVRFMGERAYVVTFRRIDPLFAIDLSKPTAPTVEGALKIPGFSNYLHPVGEDYLIGIGRDADEITGRVGPLQITLFNVADLAAPTVADQVTFEDALWVTSEAWFDHHAVSYFADSGVLAIPISWTEQVANAEGSGYAYESLGAVFTFKIDISGETASIAATGRIEHERVDEGSVYNGSWVRHGSYLSRPQRSLRIGESLVTVSQDWIEVHDLNAPDDELGRFFLGPPARNDSFTVEEDSGANPLDVLTNDSPDYGGYVGPITAVSQPMSGGVVTMGTNSRELIFTPDDDFFGAASFTYTIDDPQWGERTATVNVYVQNTPDAPVANDDQFTASVDSQPIVLDVLANDSNPDWRQSIWPVSYYLDDILFADVATLSVADYVIWPVGVKNGLALSAPASSENGGAIQVDNWGKLNYTPAQGFRGWDSFLYTVENASGLTDTATVTLWVGAERPQKPLDYEVAAPEMQSSRQRALSGRPSKPLAAPPAASQNERTLLLVEEAFATVGATETEVGAARSAESELPSEENQDPADRDAVRRQAFRSVLRNSLSRP